MAGLRERKRENRVPGIKWILFWTVKLERHPERHPKKDLPKSCSSSLFRVSSFTRISISRWSNLCFQHHNLGQLQSAFPWSIHDSQGTGQLMVFHDERRRFWVKDEKRGTGGKQEWQKEDTWEERSHKGDQFCGISILKLVPSSVFCFVLFFSLG